MNRNLKNITTLATGLGFLLILAAIGAGIYFLFQNFWPIVSVILMIVGGIAILGLVWFLFSKRVYGKNWYLKSGLDMFLGPNLVDSADQFFVELEKGKLNPTTKGQLAANVIKRLTRIAVIGFILAIVPIWLLMNQNKLLERQNEKFDLQNQKIDLQNNLLEADRRSSLVFLMSNVLDKVDDEIKEQRGSLKKEPGYHPDSVKYKLSQPLISRIIGLSRAFKPYRIMEGNSLSSELVSPERGQFFIALMENNLDSITQNTIVKDGDFSYSVIGEINLSGAKLSEANLVGANLSRAFLYEASLSEAYLSGANLNGANLSGANFDEVLLITVDQLLSARLLSRWENLDSTIEKELSQKKPCLFTEQGCITDPNE